MPLTFLYSVVIKKQRFHAGGGVRVEALSRATVDLGVECLSP